MNVNATCDDLQQFEIVLDVQSFAGLVHAHSICSTLMRPRAQFRIEKTVSLAGEDGFFEPLKEPQNQSLPGLESYMAPASEATSSLTYLCRAKGLCVDAAPVIFLFRHEL